MLAQVGSKLGVMKAMLAQIERLGGHLGPCWLHIGALLDKRWAQDPKMVEKVAQRERGGAPDEARVDAGKGSSSPLKLNS